MGFCGSMGTSAETGGVGIIDAFTAPRTGSFVETDVVSTVVGFDHKGLLVFLVVVTFSFSD